MATTTKLQAVPAANANTMLSFPFDFEVLELRKMFVDKDYQRPLSGFFKTVRDNFDPALIGCMVINVRKGGGAKPFAVVDGQTRWMAMSELGFKDAPTIVYRNLSPEQEASLFERLQTQRKGVISYHRFRAALSAKNPEAVGINSLVKACGYTVGAKAGTNGPISAVAALEYCYRQDVHTLERVLVTLREAWQHATPSGAVLRGCQQFFKTRENVDDERLVRRLSTVTENEILKRAAAFREASGHASGPAARYISMAVAAQYDKRLA